VKSKQERPIEVRDFVIINEFDKPCTRLVAQVVKIENGRVTGRYITEETTLEFCTGDIAHATLVSAFGVALNLSDGYVEGIQIGDSSATYPDGRPRLWQPDDHSERYKLREAVR